LPRLGVVAGGHVVGLLHAAFTSQRVAAVDGADLVGSTLQLNGVARVLLFDCAVAPTGKVIGDVDTA